MLRTLQVKQKYKKGQEVVFDKETDGEIVKVCKKLIPTLNENKQTDTKTKLYAYTYIVKSHETGEEKEIYQPDIELV